MVLRTILLIDDDEYIRDVYQEILTKAGFLVTTATNGNEGISFLKNGGFDLVLLDVMMPHQNGIDVLTQLKNLTPAKTIGPIILLTNLAHDPVVQEGLRLGAQAVLIKSDINPEELVTYIKNFVAKQSS